MRIVVADLPKEERRLVGELEIDLDPDGSPDELSTTGAVGYDIGVEREGERVRVEGRVTARVVARCSRCARQFDIEVDRSFAVRYQGASDGDERPPTELDESDLSLDYYEGEAIDGDRLLAEQVLLALPMKLLCVDDCRGLCPLCGANRNDTECGCEVEGDPRLASLKAIRDRL